MLEVMESPAADVWQEVAYVERPCAQVAAVGTQHRIADGDQQPRAAWTGCRCWRCFPHTGGVSHSDKRALDRIMGRHLARMSEVERDSFLAQWSGKASHGLCGRLTLEAWVRIANGSREPEPVYSTED